MDDKMMTRDQQIRVASLENAVNASGRLTSESVPHIIERAEKFEKYIREGKDV